MKPEAFLNLIALGLIQPHIHKDKNFFHKKLLGQFPTGCVCTEEVVNSKRNNIL